MVIQLRARPCSLMAVGLCLLALTGCATAQAKNAADVPALDVPPPPARTIEVAETDPAQPATLPGEPSRHVTPQPPPRRPPPPRTETKDPKDQNAKPEPPATASSEAPKPAEALRPPPSTLQTTPAEAEGKEDQQIRALLHKASNDLSRIDYQRLNTDARTQYDTAKRFVTQAENALRTKNLVLARSVADKAAALAAQLSGK